MPINVIANTVARAREALHELSRANDNVYRDALADALAESDATRELLARMDLEAQGDDAGWASMGSSLAELEAQLANMPRPPRGGGRAAALPRADVA